MDHQCVEMGREGVHGPSMCLDGERGSTWTINVFRWGEGVHGPSMC